MIRLLLVDDQPLVRAGLRMVFEPEADVTIVGEAVDGDEAVRLAGELAPDVVLMDIRMPRRDDIYATRAILATAEARVCWCSPRSTTTSTCTRRYGPGRAASC